MSNQSDAIKAPTYYQGVFTHDQITLSSRGEETRESLEPARTSSLAAGGPLNLPRYVPKYSVKQRILGTLKSWRGSQDVTGKIDLERSEPVYAIPNKKSTKEVNRGSSPAGERVGCCKCCALVTVVLILFAVGSVGIGLGVYYGLFYTEQGTSSTSPAPNTATALRVNVSTSTRLVVTSLPFANTVGAIATIVSGNLATTVASNAAFSATASTNNHSIVLTTNIAATLAVTTNGVTPAESTIPATSDVVGTTTRQQKTSSMTDLSNQLPVATSNPTTQNNAVTTIQLRQSTSS